MAFHVGQRVVCVNDRPINGPHLGGLKRGQVYTVSGFGACADGSLGVHVEEIWREGGTPFFAHRFRPVVERKTSIAIFEAMLTPSQVEA